MSLRATVACVIEQQGRFLMVEEHRGGPLTLFNQPAGHIEAGEGPMAAVLREVAEETAWRVRLIGYLGLYVFTTPEGLTFHSHGFIAEPTECMHTALDPDIHAIHWLSREDIEMLDNQQRLRSSLVLARIDDARKQRIYPLDVIHENAVNQ